MVCLGFDPRVTGWQAQTIPLSYGGTLNLVFKSAQFNELHSQIKSTCGHHSPVDPSTSAILRNRLRIPTEQTTYNLLFREETRFTKFKIKEISPKLVKSQTNKQLIQQIKRLGCFFHVPPFFLLYGSSYLARLGIV